MGPPRARRSRNRTFLFFLTFAKNSLTLNPKGIIESLNPKYRRLVMAKDTQKDGKIAVSFWVEKDIADKLDYLAEKGGITKSKLLSNIVEVVVHDMMIVDKLGIIKLGRFYYELREGIKNKTTKYKDKKIMSDIMEDKKEEE